MKKFNFEAWISYTQESGIKVITDVKFKKRS